MLITSLTNVTVADEQLSLAVTDVGSGAGTAEAHCTVNGAGQVMVGLILSITVTVKLQVAV